MNKYESILKNQLKKISLSKKELKILKEISDEVIFTLKKNNLDVFVGGSFAKGTIIKKEGLQDIDVFVVFEEEKEVSKLEKVLNKTKFKKDLEKIHGSRDYFHIINDNVILEIIPVVRNKSNKINNVTDISLSHVKYILNKLKESPDLVDEIKLAKSFVQACNCYGAESYIKGFSGYAIEVLVIYFGGFIKFLKSICKEKVIDLENFFKNKKMIPYELNESKIQGPLIVIDPTYKYRNICAGLSDETYNKFIKISKDFLKKPTNDFFKIKKINIKELKEFSKKKELNLIEINLSTKKQKGDIAATKMKKFFDFIIDEFKRNKQEVLDSFFEYDKNNNLSRGFIIIKKNETAQIQGPPIKLKEKVKEFNKLHKDSFEKKGYLYYNKLINLEGIVSFCRKFQGDMDVKIKDYRIY